MYSFRWRIRETTNGWLAFRLLGCAFGMPPTATRFSNGWQKTNRRFGAVAYSPMDNCWRRPRRGVRTSKLIVWNAATHRLVREIESKPGFLLESRDSPSLAIRRKFGWCVGGVLVFWDRKTGKNDEDPILDPENGAFQASRWRRWKGRICGTGTTLYRYDLEANRLLDPGKSLRLKSFLARRIASRGCEIFRLWRETPHRLLDSKTGVVARELSADEGVDGQFEFSPDGRLLVSNGDECLIVWSVADGRLVDKFPCRLVLHASDLCDRIFAGSTTACGRELVDVDGVRPSTSPITAASSWGKGTTRQSRAWRSSTTARRSPRRAVPATCGFGTRPTANPETIQGVGYRHNSSSRSTSVLTESI